MKPCHVTIYTDGACSGNPGPGGIGIILISQNHKKEISKGYRLTTNNRMELLAIILALEAIKIIPCEIDIYTDSQYISKAITEGWLFNWEKKQFKKVKNADLWKRFLKIFRQHHVSFHWIKGHDTNPFNNRCDTLARQAIRKQPLEIDEIYEREIHNEKLL